MKEININFVKKKRFICSLLVEGSGEIGKMSKLLSIKVISGVTGLKIEQY